jgi:DNA-3-methyladenine glycosylase I
LEKSVREGRERMTTRVRRCVWPKNDLAVDYHDREWGMPAHDDRALFEALVLGGFQAGLSWDTILQKRGRFQKAFSGFDPVKVARFDRRKIERLLADEGIIRNRQKIDAAVANAKAVIGVRKEFGSFDAYLWRFVGGRPKRNRWKREEDIPVESEEARALSDDLRSRGFRFVGPTICYAFMQAVGMVNDHVVSCFRYREVRERGE